MDETKKAKATKDKKTGKERATDSVNERVTEMANGRTTDRTAGEAAATTVKDETTRLLRTHKDSVFCMLFNDRENLISLYNALAGTDYGPDTPLDFDTIEEILFKTLKNDIAFTMEDSFIVILEHQSSVNENMAVRDLIYYATILQQKFDNRSFYKETRLEIPAPEFIVLYNGAEDMPDFYEIRLSDSYGNREKEPSLQLTVKVYNVNEGRNPEIQDRCRILKEYSRFVSIVRSHAKKGRLEIRDVQAILKQCREEGILMEFLKKHGEEAVNMLFLEMTEEEARALSKEEGYELGLEKGRKSGLLETARNMKTEGLSLEMIAKCTGLTVAEIEKL